MVVCLSICLRPCVPLMGYKGMPRDLSSVRGDGVGGTDSFPGGKDMEVWHMNLRVPFALGSSLEPRKSPLS